MTSFLNFLSRGTVRQMHAGTQVPKPVLQVVDVKNINKSNADMGNGRFRLVVSDGEHYMQAMLSSNLNNQVGAGMIEKNCIVRVNTFVLNDVANGGTNDKKISVFLDLDVLHAAGVVNARLTFPDVKKLQNVSKVFGARQPLQNLGQGGQQHQQPYSAGAPPPQQRQNQYGQQQQQQQQQQHNSYGQQQQQQRQPYNQQPNPYNNNNNNSSNMPNPYNNGNGNNYGQQNQYGQQHGGNYQQQPSYNGNGNSYQANNNNNSYGATSSVGGMQVMPINSLNPYQNAWTIKVKVTKKDAMKSWSNAKGDGTLFSMEFVDSQGTDMRGTFFKEDAQKWHPVIQEGQVYLISGGRLKMKNPKWNQTRAEYEVTFGRDTTIEAVKDNTAAAASSWRPHIDYNFQPIANIERLNPDDIVDVLGVITNVQDAQERLSKKGNPYFLREIEIVDDSSVSIRVSVFGEQAQPNNNAAFANNPIMALKNAKVGDFGGRNLSVGFGGKMELNPQHPRSHQLRGWFQHSGQASSVRQLSSSGGGSGKGKMPTGTPGNERYTLKQVREDNVGQRGEEDEFIDVQATLKHVWFKNRPIWYTSCPEDSGSKKKVTRQDDGTYLCEATMERFDTCKHRYIFNMVFVDGSGNLSGIKAFNDQGEILLGKTADELAPLWSEDETSPDMEIFARHIKSKCYQKYNLKLKCKQNEWNGDVRTEYTIVGMKKIEGEALIQDCHDILAALGQYQNVQQQY